MILFDSLTVKEEWKDRLAISAEDYLHGLISLVNELVRLSIDNFEPLVWFSIQAPRHCLLLPMSGKYYIVHGHINHISDHKHQSRLAVNAVTLGNFDEPIRISIFVKDLFAGFSMVT
jgi:hypothetical protein